jgi:hypothetical protein
MLQRVRGNSALLAGWSEAGGITALSLQRILRKKKQIFRFAAGK